MRGLAYFCVVVAGVVFLAPAVGQTRGSAAANASLTQSQQQELKKAEDLNSRFTTLYNAGKALESAQFAEESLAIRRKILGEEHIDTAISMNNYGLALHAQGRNTHARPLLEQTLKVYLRVYGDEHSFTANAHNNLGLVLLALNDYATARPHFEKAVTIWTKVLGEEHASTATALNNLGMLLQDQGDATGALRYYERALNIRLKVLGREHHNTASSLNNLGYLLKQQGNYGAARSYYEQSLEINKKLLGEFHPNTASSRGNLGLLLRAQGDYAEAERHLEQAVAICEEVFGNEHAETAKALNNLGLLYQDQGFYTKAQPYFERALEIRKKVLAENHLDTAMSFDTLGYQYRILGNNDAAQRHYDRALEIRKNVLDKEHPLLAMTYNNISGLMNAKGDYAASEKYLRKALQIRMKVLGEEHPDTSSTLNNLSGALAVQGKIREAIEVLDRSRRGSVNFMIRNLAFLDATSQAKFLLSQNVKWHGALSIVYANQTNPFALTSTANWLINGKGVSSAVLAEQQLLQRVSDDPKVKGSIERLEVVRRDLATLVMSTPQRAEAESRKKLIAQLIEEERKLNRQIAQDTVSSTDPGQWIELDEVRQSIASGSVLINFVRMPIFKFDSVRRVAPWEPAHYLAWLIPASGEGEVRFIDLGLADELDVKIGSLRKKMSDVNSKESFDKELQRCAQQVWKPIAEKISDDINGIVISPDGALWLLPWACLPTGKDRFLIEDYALRYVISGRELVESSSLKGNAWPLVFADPTFDLAPDERRNAVEAIFRNEKVDWDTKGGTTSRSAIGKVAALPGTRAEADSIAPSLERITGKKPVSYLGKYALETVVKRVDRPRMIVLSTHGFFRPLQTSKDDTQPATNSKTVDNPLLRCGLLLAGCNQPAIGPDDGVLTGMEIVGMDLRGTELVVLSACETGLGDVHDGEGVAGLRQAFQLAGAQGVVSTLWSVPDRDSAIIMKDFFANLAQGDSKAEALRNAQLKRVASRRQRYGSAHPFYWAAWTMTGR